MLPSRRAQGNAQPARLVVSRAFRRSMGMPPHRWLVRQRIEQAKALLREGRAPLAEISLACGFADQSHFTRCFSAWTGVSPGRWRRTIGK